MAHKGEPQEGGLGLRQEELPQMDGSCDACEPDEAQPATQVCHTCSFAFCSVHADRHGSSTHHPLMPYNHEGTQANGLGSKRDPGVGNGAKDEARMEGAALMDVDDGEEQQGEAERGSGSKNGQPLASELGDGANGAEAEEEAMAAGETGKREFVTVERLRCKEHGEEGSLYCKTDEKIICVVCAVRGDHREHEIITLHEAYIWQKNKDGYDMLGCTQQMGEKIMANWTNPNMSPEELEAYVDSQFDELRKVVRLEEKRTLHLIDLKAAFLTAAAGEKIAEINVETERLQEEMDNITHQLFQLEKGELAAAPAPVHRLPRDIEARPRLPEPRGRPMDPRDYGDRDSGPSMDHAP